MTESISNIPPVEFKEFPEDWDIKKLRFLFEERGEKTEEKDARLLSVSREHGVLPRSTITDQESRAETTEGYKKVAPGDLVVNIMLAWDGALGVSQYEGVVSPSYEVYYPSDKIHPNFYSYLLRSPLYQYEFARYSTGVVPSRWRLYTQDLYDIRVPVPPIEIQKNISAFLDEEKQNIIEMKENIHNLLSVLDEKKSSYISNKVTKGVEKQTLTKKSKNVDWLQEMPSHWDESRLKYVSTSIIDSEHKTPPTDPDGDYHIVRTADISDGEIILDETQMADNETYKEWTTRGKPTSKDLILTREAPAGEVGIIPESKDNVLLGQRTVLIKPDTTSVLPEFLCYVLQSDIIDWFIDLTSRGSTVDHINMSDLKNIPIPLPPLPEQRKIVEDISTEINNITKLEDSLQRGIDLSDEKIQTLIIEAVSGKMNLNLKQIDEVEP